MVKLANGRVWFECAHCGWQTAKWVGRCGGCAEWDCLAERVQGSRVGAGGGSRAGGGGRRAGAGPPTTALPISQVACDAVRVWPTGIGEVDRVLGGGIVPGAVILVAGEPGAGKSTLVLDVAARAARGGRRVLYVSGEESAGQVRLRAERIGALAPGLLLCSAQSADDVVDQITAERAELVVVDSVQTLSTETIEGGPGGLAQVRAVTALLIEVAKAQDVAVLLVGHVTKDGAVAGPRTLEHLVDTVCLFEGERHTRLRILRATKNRFGPADEIGCFELGEAGIAEVSDPSGLFVGPGWGQVPGTCLGIALEGRRPLTVEVQALVAQSVLASPRRTVSGLDPSRLAMILAVLQRRCGLGLSSHDVYAATVGGARAAEPALDLAIALACVSGLVDLAVPAHTAVIGEVGLGGEVRPVGGMSRRLAEAARLGLGEAIVPVGTEPVPGIQLIEVADVAAAARLVLAPAVVG